MTKDNYKPGSDIDLMLMGDAMDYQVLSPVASALEESNIPYSVDVSVFDKIENPALREHIERVGLDFYQRADRAAL
jgi:predicted nucleotidyltransferase